MRRAFKHPGTRKFWNVALEENETGIWQVATRHGGVIGPGDLKARPYGNRGAAFESARLEVVKMKEAGYEENILPAAEYAALFERWAEGMLVSWKLNEGALGCVIDVSPRGILVNWRGSNLGLPKFDKRAPGAQWMAPKSLTVHPETAPKVLRDAEGRRLCAGKKLANGARVESVEFDHERHYYELRLSRDNVTWSKRFDSDCLVADGQEAFAQGADQTAALAQQLAQLDSVMSAAELEEFAKKLVGSPPEKKKHKHILVSKPPETLPIKTEWTLDSFSKLVAEPGWPGPDPAPLSPKKAPPRRPRPATLVPPPGRRKITLDDED